MRIAASVLTMARPQYLRQCIGALNYCMDRDKVDWYIFQDGAVNPHSRQKLVSDRDMKIARKIILDSNLPNMMLVSNHNNEGIPKQFSKAFALLDEEYDGVMVFEDDLVVGYTAVSLMIELLENFPNHCSSIYRSPEYELPDTVEEKPDVLLECKTASFKSVGMTKEFYEKIRPRRDEYMEMVKGIDYRARDHEKIKEEFGSRVSSHDSVMNKIINDEGLSRIKPAITRGMDIGAQGLHTSRENFARRKRYSPSDMAYDIDSDIENFTVEKVDAGLF